MSKRTRIGAMRSRIGISYATQSADSFGQQIESWSSPIYRWAQVLPLSGDESEKVDGVVRLDRLSITMRGGTALGSTARLTYRGATYQVKAVMDADQERSAVNAIAERIE